MSWTSREERDSRGREHPLCHISQMGRAGRGLIDDRTLLVTLRATPWSGEGESLVVVDSRETRGETSGVAEEQCVQSFQGILL